MMFLVCTSLDMVLGELLEAGEHDSYLFFTLAHLTFNSEFILKGWNLI